MRWPNDAGRSGIQIKRDGPEDPEALVMQELSQVYYIAARIRERLPQQVDLEDLVSAGVIGLMEALRSFDASKNIQFKAFAKFRIKGAILDSLRELDWGSRSLRRKGREIAEATTRLEARLGRHPVESEIAHELHWRPAIFNPYSPNWTGCLWPASSPRFPTIEVN